MVYPLDLTSSPHIPRHGSPTSAKETYNLPTEILTQIFLAGPATVSMNLRTSSPAFSIAAVSRRWRGIALSTPQLWSDINLDLDFSSSIKWLQYPRQGALSSGAPNAQGGNQRARSLWKRFAKICILRAGELPLSFTFGEWMAPPMTPLAKLGATSDRWVSLDCHIQSFLDILNDSKFTGFPNLKFITIRGGLRMSEPLEAAIASYVQVALPQASSYQVDLGKSSQHFHQLQYLPKARITHLTLSMGHEHQLRNLEAALRHTTSLRTFDLTMLFSYEGPLPLPAAYFVPVDTLTRLNLFAPARSITYALLNFGLPSVSHLYIQEKKGPSERPSPNPLEILLGPLPKLSSLSIQGLWSWDHCLALIRTSRPESLTLMDSFKSRAMRSAVCRLVEDVITNKATVSSIITFVVTSDSHEFAIPLVEDIVETLQEVALYSEFSAMSVSRAEGSGTHSLKSIDIQCPYLRVTKGTLQNFGAAQRELPAHVRIRLLISGC